MTSQPLQPDLCVLGGGAAGHALAFAAAALGLRCTLVDPRGRLGAGQAEALAERLLIDAAREHRPGTPFDLPGFRERLGLGLAHQAPEHAAGRLRSAGVMVVQAEATFADPDTVTAGGQTIRAKRFVLATGARRRRPAWTQDLDPNRLLHAAGVAGWPALPDRLAVVLDRPEGLAVAQALHRLGAEVALIAAPGFTAPFDPELMALVLAALERSGLTLHRDRTVARGEPDGTLHLAAEDGTAAPPVTAGSVLLDLRPEPAIARLALDRAGIVVREGAPQVDAGLRTTNRRVFAIGDVLGRTWPGGAALPVQVGLVLRASVFRLPARWAGSTVPMTIGTTPALAQVGSLTRGRRVSRFPITVDGAPGLAKIVSGPRGTVTGAGLVGDHAAEAIGPWTLAVARRLSVGAMAALPAPAGGAADAFRRAALGTLAARLRRPAVKRLIAWMRRLP